MTVPETGWRAANALRSAFPLFWGGRPPDGSPPSPRRH